MKKKFIFSFFFLLIIGITNVQAQDTTYLSKEEMIERIKEEEKEALKKEVISINKRMENDEITFDEAEELKKEAAEKHAIAIDKRIAALDNAIKKDSLDYVVIGYPKRTSAGELVFAVGVNNALQKGQSLNNTDFKGIGSRFAEISILATTRFAEKSNLVRLKYGLGVQFNGLKPTDNRYFVTNNNIVTLQDHALDLKKSKFNFYNLVVPLYLEFGGYELTEGKSAYKFSTANKFKFGVGGYAGVNIGNRQKLKYEEDGKMVKEKIKSSYPVSPFVYGLSAYAGFSDVSLYVKYDLSPLFKEPNTQLNNISLGLRFDL